ncbi:hypothetical protein C8D87_103528 [Lentzea atacamensis]|uniref:DUF3040 domain-containing protein n=1 Tax=Lentzea atacamensis TaxID=531938 RepID=A0ABX9EAL1_9PSEU|nr:DUF3040 domain-containing protein [Lentzea atacamensis]RAS67189.1 hypothetical protein C8D87_103528 [Lentzea atacamensis]
MGLTEHEKRELSAIEQHLAEDDPAFVTKLNTPSWHMRLSGTALFILGLLTTYVTGLVLLATGATLSSWPLIAIGAAVTSVYPVKVTVQAVSEHQRGSR